MRRTPTGRAGAGVGCLAWDDRFDRIYNQHESIALLDTIVADYASEPGFLGYYFTDEPQVTDFPLLGTIYADLRARDPVHPAFDDLLGIGGFADLEAWTRNGRRFLDAPGAPVLC